MDKNDVVSTLRLNGLHAEAEYVLELQAQRKELLVSLKDAKARIIDLIAADDGQAYKEADKSLNRIQSAITRSEQ